MFLKCRPFSNSFFSRIPCGQTNIRTRGIPPIHRYTVRSCILGQAFICKEDVNSAPFRQKEHIQKWRARGDLNPGISGFPPFVRRLAHLLLRWFGALIQAGPRALICKRINVAVDYKLCYSVMESPL